MVNFPYQGNDFEDNLAGKQGLSQYDAGFLRQLFFDMLRMRRIEEVIESKYHEDQMKSPIHLVIGQEATAVGACAALEKTDQLYSGHRTHGAYLAKGGSLKAMLSELFCRLNGATGSRGGSMHLMDKSAGMAGSSAIVAGAIPLATGAALSAQIKNETWISTVFLGDAAVEEGACWESLNFAALKQLPIVYFCENNFFSVCTPITERQPANTAIYKKAEAFGLASVQIDGSNVLAVFQAMQEAVKRARDGGGPSFIEAVVYRWRGHGGAGDDSASGYRDPQEVKDWQQHCPLEGFGELLQQHSLLSSADREHMEQGISTEIEQAFLHAENSANPGAENLSTYVYSE